MTAMKGKLGYATALSADTASKAEAHLRQFGTVPDGFETKLEDALFIISMFGSTDNRATPTQIRAQVASIQAKATKLKAALYDVEQAHLGASPVARDVGRPLKQLLIDFYSAKEAEKRTGADEIALHRAAYYGLSGLFESLDDLVEWADRSLARIPKTKTPRGKTRNDNTAIAAAVQALAEIWKDATGKEKLKKKPTGYYVGERIEFAAFCEIVLAERVRDVGLSVKSWDSYAVEALSVGTRIG